MSKNVQESEAIKGKRLAKNTIFLYLRMFVTMSISLYTSRVILNTLGIVDYGIYNIIGGFVSMFSILSTSLTNAISRFITIEIGKPTNQLNAIFSASLNIMFAISLLIFIGGEIIGYWFLNSKMNIPLERITAANWVLQCSLLTFIINLISVPYNAMIIAHEKMQIFASISIIESILKLVIVYLLYLSTYDKLIVYSILLLSVSILIRMLYKIYSERKFKDGRYHIVHDKFLVRNMLSFSGWNFFGSGAAIINTHGINILMNLFFDVTVNAARGIATQVNSAVLQFVNNFMIALNPQITKAYAQKNWTYMHNLIFRGTKFSFFLMLLIIIPLCIEAPMILKYWLNIVPQYAVPFVQWTLIISLITIFTSTLITGLHATGKIKKYMIIVGCTECLNFPITYIIFILGGTPITAYYVYFSISILLIITRIGLIKGLLNLSFRSYFHKVICRCILVGVASSTLPLLVSCNQPPSVLRILEVFLINVISTTICAFILGVDRTEKKFIINHIPKILKHRK